jgi:nucleosome-remodeling factor subunit BPTF
VSVITRCPNEVLVYYIKGVLFQVWKQRGEEYRITGNGGWFWVTDTRVGQHTPQNTVGLRAVARKLMARKVRELDALEKKDEALAGVKMETTENEIKQEKMEVEQADGEKGQAESTEDEKMEGETKETEESVKDEDATRAEEAGKHVKEDEDVEDDPKKDTKLITKLGGKGVEKEHIVLDFSQISKLYPKVDLVNVSESLHKRDLYTKITKPYSKLDGLLDRRLKQDEWESKQRRAIHQLVARQVTAKQIIAKHKVEREVQGKKESPKEKKLPEKRYQCYSSLCRNSPDHKGCYSVNCPKKKGNGKKSSDESEADEMDEVKRQIEMVDNAKDGQIDEDCSDKDSDTKSGKDSPSDNMMDASTASEEGQESDKKNDGATKSVKKRLEENSHEKDEEMNVTDRPEKVKDNQNESGSEPGQKKMVSSLVTLLKKVSTEVVKPKDSKEKGLGDEDSKEKGLGDEDSKEKGLGDEDSKEKGLGDEDSKEKGLGDEDSKEKGLGDEVKDGGGSAIRGASEGNNVCSETGETESRTESQASNKAGSSVEKVKSEKDVGITKSVKGSGTGSKKTEVGKKSNGTLNPPAEMNYAQAVRHLASLPDSKIAELQAKQPHERNTKEPLQLARFTKPAPRKGKNKKGSLPIVQKFMTKAKRKSILILEKYEAQRLARKKGHIEASGFNYNCKMNNVSWIYPCPRPSFKTAWRYRTQNLHSFSAAALQLRILWACLRWDDMNIKPPAGGTNTISTEIEITTTELLKRRDVGPYGLRSEFLVRKIIVPIGLPQPPKGKSFF